MRIDNWLGYDDWLTKDLPDDEPPLTEAELRQRRGFDMGWSRGSQVMSTIIGQLKTHMPDVEARKIVYEILIEEFEDMDWDTQQECMGEDLIFDEIMRNRHPRWFEGDWFRSDGRCCLFYKPLAREKRAI